MKRRTFINRTVMAGLAGAALAEGPLARALGTDPTGGAGQVTPKSGGTKLLRLKGAFYRHHPVDFAQGPLGALGMNGWGETVDVEAPLAETALVSMHAENIGLIPELAYDDKGPLAGYMRWLEYEGRKVDIARTVYPKILAAARAAGLNVVHVSMGDYGKKYPGYARAMKLSGPEPRTSTPRAPGTGQGPAAGRPQEPSSSSASTTTTTGTRSISAGTSISPSRRSRRATSSWSRRPTSSRASSAPWGPGTSSISVSPSTGAFGFPAAAWSTCRGWATAAPASAKG